MDRRAIYVIIGIIILGGIFWKKEAVMIELKKLADSSLKLIAQFEGFSAHPYADAQGYSVGFGHFILPSDNFEYPMSKKTAYSLLSSDAALAAQVVRDNVIVPLTQNQFDAIVSLTYNIGSGAFSSSTLLKKLNAGDYSGAASQFKVWRKSQGQVLPALVARRADEERIFLS